MCIQPELKLFSGSRLAGKISSTYVAERSSFLSKIYPTFQSSTVAFFFFCSGMLNSNLKVVNIPSLLKLIQLPVGLVAPSLRVAGLYLIWDLTTNISISVFAFTFDKCRCR